MEKILYESTNGKAEKVSFRQALLDGQAPDGGLYTPDRIPSISLGDIEALKGTPYHEVAFKVTKRFLEGEIPDAHLEKLLVDAYDFPVPIEHAFDRSFVMRLDRGPTAAFKDFAARFMARLISYYLELDDKRLLILTATSGDTGSAVANAFFGLENIEVVVLFPEREVTGMQRAQMTTLGGNVSALAVDGKFDDCQRLVKTAFNDRDLDPLNLSSANSINFGRLLPQSVYYFYAYANLFEKGGEGIVFSVPSGNFGNLMGGVLAYRMGLPVEKFVVATNANDCFPNFLKSGSFTPINPSRECISNAMNVGNPSNLARLVHFYGGFLDERGKLHKTPDMNALRKDYYSVSITDEETREAIREAYEGYSLLLEPHGAVGWAGLKRFIKETGWSGLAVAHETADPAKFPEEIEKVLDIKPSIPSSMQGLMEKEEIFNLCPNEYRELKSILKAKI